MSGISGVSLAPHDYCSNWRKSVPSVIEKLGYILRHEQFSDVSFRFWENGKSCETVKAHKLWLMTASEVFERMFNGNFKETGQDSECPIEVTDIDPSSFKTMLQFIYTGEFPKNPSVPETIGLVNATRKYDIGDLEELCWRHLTKQLTVKDSVTIFQAAQLYENKALESKALKFLKTNFDEVLESKDFVNLSVKNLLKLLRADDICVDAELQIFNGVLRWSAAKCKEKNMTLSPANKRLVFDDIINLINFSAIPAADIALSVVPSEILTFEECTLIFQHSVVSFDLFTEQLPKRPFSDVFRQRRTHVATFSGVKQKPVDFSHGFNHFIFKVDKTIKIVGLGLPGHPESKNMYTVSFSLVDPYKSAELSTIKKKATFPSNSILAVDLVEPVEINPHHEYMVNFKIEGLPIPWSSSSGVVVSKNGVNFTSKPNQVTISQIKFKLM